MFYITLVFWILFDLTTKYFVNIYLEKKINLIWDFLYLELFKNPWIAFSIEVNSIILKIVTISLVVAIFLYYKNERKKNELNKNILDISFWLILAWAIWNWLERVFNSEVIDFIWVMYFSVFNVADSLIFIWAVIYLILNYKKVK